LPASELIFERLQPGRWHVSIEAPYGMAKGELDLVGGETRELRLDLAAWAGVRGRVVDARTGAPQAGLYPVVFGTAATLGDMMKLATSMVGAMSGGAELRIDGDGRFVLDRLPPGPLEVTFLAVPALDPVAVLKVDALRPGEVRDVGNVEGLALAPVAKSDTGTFGLATVTRGEEADRALVIETVAPRSPAAKAGLRVGDRIVAVDGFTVARLGRRVVGRLLDESHLERGSKHRVRVERDRAELDFELVAAPAGKR
jgi:hypothetical protein